jgi:hypothetical protein
MRRVPLGGGPGQPSLAARSPGGVCSLDQRSRLVPVSSTAASLPQTVLKTGARSIKLLLELTTDGQEHSLKEAGETLASRFGLGDEEREWCVERPRRRRLLALKPGRVRSTHLLWVRTRPLRDPHGSTQERLSSALSPALAQSASQTSRRLNRLPQLLDAPLAMGSNVIRYFIRR